MAKYFLTSKKVSNSVLKLKVRNKLIFEKDKAMGQCWPNTKQHVIEIDPRQCPKDYLDTLVHEALHELFPKKREKYILQAGTTIANLLWRLGYRRVKKRG